MAQPPFYLVSRQSAAKQLRETLGDFEPSRAKPLHCEVDLCMPGEPLRLSLDTSRAVHTLIRQIRRGDFAAVRFQDPGNPATLHRLGIHLGLR